MTKNEFIQRAAIAMVGGNTFTEAETLRVFYTSIRDTAVALADTIEQVSFFDPE